MAPLRSCARLRLHHDGDSSCVYITMEIVVARQLLRMLPIGRGPTADSGSLS